MYYARKSDSNQAQIVRDLRKIGFRVKVVSRYPKMLDLIVLAHGQLWWVEVKNEGEDLNAREKSIFLEFNYDRHLIVGHSTEEILKKMED